MIHPTAVVHPKAKLDSTVRVGPHAVIDEHVELGPGCVVGPHVYLTGVVVAGARNRFHSGCVIGDAPVDLKYSGEATRVRLGNDNVFREHVTVNCSNTLAEDTVIGSGNFLTPHCHVGHNTRIGDHVILGGGAMLAGHVVVEDRAFISGNCLVHQFCRIGALSLMQGAAAVSKDLPPFTVASGLNGIVGLNMVGLRRAGFKPDERLELKRVYHALFRAGQNIRLAVDSAQAMFNTPGAKRILDFIVASKRGVCTHVGAAPPIDS
jgi:UDP-N-acetylglucosamine acyltransferase